MDFTTDPEEEALFETIMDESRQVDRSLLTTIQVLTDFGLSHFVYRIVTARASNLTHLGDTLH